MSMRNENRAILMRKLMTICPVCGKLIFGRDIDLEKVLDRSKTKSWPTSYEHWHSHNGGQSHLIRLFIDANCAVRSFETSNQIV